MSRGVRQNAGQQEESREPINRAHENKRNKPLICEHSGSHSGGMYGKRRCIPDTLASTAERRQLDEPIRTILEALVFDGANPTNSGVQALALCFHRVDDTRTDSFVRLDSGVLVDPRNEEFSATTRPAIAAKRESPPARN